MSHKQLFVALALFAALVSVIYSYPDPLLEPSSNNSGNITQRRPASSSEGTEDFDDDKLDNDPDGDNASLGYGKADAKFRSSVDKYLSWVPEGAAKRGMAEYFNYVGNIHGGANESIEIKNMEIMARYPCVAELATEFNNWMLEQDLENTLRAQLPRGHNPIWPRPSLADEAGKGTWNHVKPGILWEKALEISGGDGNLAMQLVGFCGHDDALNKRPTLGSYHPAFERLARHRKQIEEKYRPLFLAKLAATPSGSNHSAYLTYLSSLATSGNGDGLEFACLPSSMNYLPGALGSDSNLGDDLRNRIANTQAPNKGARFLPAKYYHVVGAALLGCKVKAQSGVNYLGATMGWAGARAYRGIRLPVNPEYGIAQKSADLDLKQLTPELIERFRKILESDDQFAQAQKMLKDETDQAFYNLVGDKEKLRGANSDEIRDTILKSLARRDAMHLAAKWYSKVEVPGLGSIWLMSPLRKHEIEAIKASARSSLHGFAITPALVFYEANENCLNKSWPKDRCRRALDVLETWKVDFEWSQSQHWIGARFGENACRKQESEEDLEEQACKALRTQQRGRTSKPTGSVR